MQDVGTYGCHLQKQLSYCKSNYHNLL